MSGWFSIKFNNTFVFSDPEPPIISILLSCRCNLLSCRCNTTYHKMENLLNFQQISLLLPSFRLRTL